MKKLMSFVLKICALLFLINPLLKAGGLELSSSLKKEISKIEEGKLDLASRKVTQKKLHLIIEFLIKNNQAKNITTLSLENNQLSKLPESMVNLTELKELNLKGNKLKNFPSCLGKLNKLEFLNLSDNAYTKILPDIEALTHLKILDLSANGICSWNADCSKLAELRTLCLAVNMDLRNFDFIGHFPNLEELDLSVCKCLSQLPITFKNLHKLKKLKLYITGLKELPEFIGEMKDLEHLELQGTSLKTLPVSMESLNNLVLLNLEDNPFLIDVPKNLKPLFNRLGIYESYSHLFPSMRKRLKAKLNR